MESSIAKNFSRGAKSYDNHSHKQLKQVELAIIWLEEYFLQYEKKQPLLKSWIDLGCGTGMMAIYLKFFFYLKKIWAYDFSNEMIGQAKKNAISFFEHAETKRESRYTFLQSEKSQINHLKKRNVLPIHLDQCQLDFLKIDISKKDFWENAPQLDGISAMSVLHWMDEVSEVIGHIGSHLKKNGLFIGSLYLTDTYRELDKLVQTGFRKKLPSLGEIANLMSANGLKIIKSIENREKLQFGSLASFFNYQRKQGSTLPSFRDDSHQAMDETVKPLSLISRGVKLRRAMKQNSSSKVTMTVHHTLIFAKKC